MAFDARVAKRGVFIPPEGENGLGHVLGVEHLEANQKVEILHGESGHRLKQIGFSTSSSVCVQGMGEPVSNWCCPSRSQLQLGVDHQGS